MWNGMELSWGAYLKVLLNRELIWSESCLIWGWLHFLRVLVSLRRRGVRMQVRNKRAFTEAWLDLQFNATRIKKKKKIKKKKTKTNKLLGWGWMPGVSGFFCSSAYSSGRRLWIWAEKEAFKCILCHSGERVDSERISSPIWLAGGAWLGIAGVILCTVWFSQTTPSSLTVISAALYQTGYQIQTRWNWIIIEMSSALFLLVCFCNVTRF